MLGYFFLGKYMSDGKWCLPGVCCTHNLEWMHLWLKERQTSIHLLPDGQVGLFPDCFGLRSPDAGQTSFSFPEGPIAVWVYAPHLRPFPLNDYISILSSPNHPFEIVLVIYSEQFTILIALAFSLCIYDENWLFAHVIQNLIFMSNWANGLCTQVRFVYQFCSHVWQILANRNSSFPQPYLFLRLLMYAFLTLCFETTASYKNWADWHNRLASSSVTPIMLWFWELENSENLREPNSGIPKLVALCHWFRGWT